MSNRETMYPAGRLTQNVPAAEVRLTPIDAGPSIPADR